ncbi:hypothetical protein [Motilibacter aurantiacus]|uniref:hypothetical protein n=1 Tax=Motilibacter aurantiacus TaxID=2714955 RepID=UPI00140AFA58|nr:hypothetical protein [Motilibacter aurantiacus]NHC46014.1 hypothetical protein [Motilibacter aurantiacus]
MRSRVLLRARRGEDSGFTLVAVVVAMTVLMLMLLSALAYVVRDLKPGRENEDGLTALAAAQAGVDEFVSRLNGNGLYYQTMTADRTNLAVVNPNDPVASRSIGVAAPGTGGVAGYFKYWPLGTATETARTGIIRLRVTGTSGSGPEAESRTLTVQLQRKTLLNYLWNTQFEVQDPLVYKDAARADVSGSASPGNNLFYAADPRIVEALCSARYFRPAGAASTVPARASTTYKAGTSFRMPDGTTYSNPYYNVIDRKGNVVNGPYRDGRTVTSVCRSGELSWTTGDVVDGPLHSNDALSMSGTPAFLNPKVETGWSTTSAPAADAGRGFWYGSGGPLTSYGGRAAYQPAYAPDVALPATNSDLRASAVTDGCVYTGETQITFSGTTMTVYSPNTTTTKSGCFNGNARSSAQTYPIPPVVYVDQLTGTCLTSLGFERATMVQNSRTNDYDCSDGDAYVQGTVSGQVTVASADEIVVTGDLKYASGLSGTDVIGLVANGFVWVYHPVNANDENLLTSAASVHYIDAALTSLSHSFAVENSSSGAGLSSASSDASKLNIRGVIVQKFRGAVGTGGGASGYLKNYIYDARLANQPPPYYSRPVDTTWNATLLSDG